MRVHRILAVGLVGVALLGNACSGTTPSTPGPDGETQQAITTDFRLQSDMRQLWEDHVFWTHTYLESFLGGLAGTEEVKARLIRNQVDLGDAIKPFYGNDAGDALTGLLKDHISGAVDVVVAAKANDAAALVTAKANWYANGAAIAAFLASANPNWNAADLAAMMVMHLDQTILSATAMIKGDWAAGVVAYDAIEAHIVRMADALSAGIAAQFPKKVSVDAMDAADRVLHLALRTLWVQHVAWTHFYLVSAIGGLPDAQVCLDRLLKNQLDLGVAVQPFYGVVAGDQLAQLLHDHISGAVAVVLAAKSGDAQAIATLKAAWYANADQIAVFLAGLNPNLAVVDLKSHMRTHLDLAFAEAAARLGADWKGDIDATNGSFSHIVIVSDALSAAITKQFATR